MPASRLLIVEDDSVTATYLRDILHTLGYEVVGSAMSGEEAIRKAADLQPDLVLMDILLAGNVDGVAATETITSQYHLPVVLVTAFADENTIQRAIRSNPYGLVMKPYEGTALRAAIELALYRHRLEKKSGEVGYRWSTTIQWLSEAVISTNATGAIVFMNPAAETLTGWKKEDAMGRGLKEIFNVIEDLSDDSSGFGDSIFGGSAVRSTRKHPVLISKDGTRIPIDYSSTVVRDSRKNIDGWVLFVRNVTAQRRLEDALSQSRKKYKQLVNSIDGIVWEADAQTGNFEFVSAQAQHILGFPTPLWLGDTNFWTDHLYEKDRERALAARAAATANRSNYECEYRMVGASGQIVWFRDTGIVAVEGDGSVKLRGVMINITAWKKAQGDLRKDL